MKIKLGFESESTENEYGFSDYSNAKKSVVQIHFPEKNMTLSYYNDMFDLHEGDIVFVEGKLEGIRGFVLSVSYNFKIHIQDYMKVISVADTDIKGRFYHTEDHFITFENNALPKEKALSWFRAIEDENDLIWNTDDSSFPLDNLEKMDIGELIRQRGESYYNTNRVRYISLDGNNGFAIVEGSEHYTVEFEYNNGQISRLLCDCYCSYNCKHMYAVMLQLKEMLEVIKKNYAQTYEETKYFAAICKADVFNYCIRNKNNGHIDF